MSSASKSSHLSLAMRGMSLMNFSASHFRYRLLLAAHFAFFANSMVSSRARDSGGQRSPLALPSAGEVKVGRGTRRGIREKVFPPGEHPAEKAASRAPFWYVAPRHVPRPEAAAENRGSREGRRG